MKIFATFCCAAYAFGSSLLAQSVDHLTVHFNSPVLVGETKMPAGDCDIRVMQGASDTTILVLRSQGGPSIAAPASRLSDIDSDATGSNASVVFTRHGDDLQLNRIVFSDHTGYQLTNVQ